MRAAVLVVEHVGASAGGLAGEIPQLGEDTSVGG
jgi:hypothetical protein